MKKIYLLLILGILLIGFIGAEELLQFDNHKDYDELTKTMTIENTFGIGRTIADIRLLTEQKQYVPSGKDRLVAKFELNSYDDMYTGALEKVQFYNTYNLNNEINRQFTYKILSYKDVIVPDSPNGTKGYSYKEEVWTPFDSSKIARGTYTIGIFTDVYYNDNVEWIPTFYGVKITEWAGWVSDSAIIDGLSVGSGAYYYINIFEADSSLYALVGTGTTPPNGFVRLVNGTWVLNSTISAGFSTSADFQVRGNTFSVAGSDDLYTIIGIDGGGVLGYTRLANLTWIKNTTITNGLPTSAPPYAQSPTKAFFIDETWYLLVGGGDTGGKTRGYKWNGTGWAVNTTIATGIPTIGVYERPEILKDKTGATHLIIGSDTDLLYGYTWNGAGATWVINESINESLPDLGTESIPAIFNLTDEEFYIIAQNGGGASGFNITLSTTPPTFNPKVTFNSPDNYYNTTNPSITFNVTTFCYNVAGTIENVTLYIDGVLNETNSTQTINGTYVFTKILSESSHNWSILLYDNYSIYNQTDARFLIIDNTNPIVNIESPTSGSDVFLSLASSNSTNASILWTAYDLNLDTCIITNLTSGANETGTCNDLNNTYSVPFGTHIFFVYANDSVGQYASDSVSANYKYKVYEINQTYNNPTIERNSENFFANVYLDSSLSVSNVYFNYNGTNYSAGYSTIGNYTRLTKANFEIPDGVAEIVNNTFTWFIVLNNTNIIELSTQTQNVYNLSFGNCTYYSYKMFNLNLVDEKTQSDINGTIETNIQIRTRNGTSILYNWTSTITNTSTALCSNVSIYPNSSYSVWGTIKYYSVTENYSASTEYYNFLNFSLTNNTQYQNVTLYDLNVTEATDFQLTFKDSSYQARENILIYVYREYIPEGTFKVVELPKTDSNGQTIVHLVRNDVVYNLIAIDSTGEILGLLNNVIAFCQDYTIGDCVINFQGTTIETQLQDFLTDLGLYYTLSYSPTTHVISFEFSSSTAELKDVRMEVIQSAIVTNRTFCNTSLSAISGTLTCDVSELVNTSSSVTIKIYVDGIQKIQDSYTFDESSHNIAGVMFAGFLLLLTIGIFFMESKEGMIIGTILGLIVMISLGIFHGRIIGFNSSIYGASSIIWIIIVGIILLIKLNEESK